MALTLRSQRQVQADILNAIISRIGLTDVNPGSILDLLTAAVAQEDFNQYVQMSQIARLVDLDSTTGTDLENRAFEYGLTRTSALRATGQVTITRLTAAGAAYAKVSTSFVSAGVLAPSIGDTVLNLNDASMFGSGTNNVPVGGDALVIGRGLSNEEERSITNVAQSGSTYQVTISPALTENHAFTEEVVFIPTDQASAGNIVISAGTTVSIPASGTTAQIDYATLVDNTIFPGEAELTNIDVRALEAGAVGNAGANTVTLIDFTGLSTTNTSAFTTGTDIESDAGLRDRIRSSIQSLSRGTQEAVLNATVGVVDADTSKRVVSANVVLGQSASEPVKVYIDDGTGFEPSFLPQAFETLIDSATQGTSRLQLDFAPVVKASIESANSEPFVLTEVANAPSTTGLTLTVQVGAVEETISLLLEDVEFPSTVRAEEIVKVINNKSTIAEARTSETGTKIVITGIADTNEDIFVDRDATTPEFDLNTYVQFTNDQQSTLYLYKNNALQTKDGTTGAIVNGGSSSTFSFGSSLTELVLIVDAKTGNNQSVLFDPTADSRLSGTVAASTVATIVNEQVSGAVATTRSNGTKLEISTNTTLSSSGSVGVSIPSNNRDVSIAITAVTPATPSITVAIANSGQIVVGDVLLITTGANITSHTVSVVATGTGIITVNNTTGLTTSSIITTIQSAANANANTTGPTFAFVNSTGGDAVATPDEGTTSDYTLNRELGTVEFSTVLATGDSVTAGNIFSRAAIRTPIAVDISTRINSGVGFSIAFDGGTAKTILFSDDRFSSAYLDDTQTRTSNNEFGFSRTTALTDATFIPNRIVEYINKQIYPSGKAILREVSGSNFIEITTNTYSSNQVRSSTTISSNGTIQASNPSSLPLGIWQGIAFDLLQNERPHQAFRENTVAETATTGFRFSPTDTLIAVIDNDLTNGTFVLPLGYFDTIPLLTGGVTGNFTGNQLNAEFVSALFANDSDYYPTGSGPDSSITNGKGEIPDDINIVDYYCAMMGRVENTDGTTTKLGASDNRNCVITSNANSFNVTLGATPRDASAIAQVVLDTTAGTATYSIGGGSSGQFTAGDFALAGVAVGDLVTFDQMTNSINDGTFVITAINDAPGTGLPPTVTVLNSSAVAESGSNGEAVLSLVRRVTGEQISGTSGSPGFTGNLTFTTVWRDAVQSPGPTNSDAQAQYALMPSTYTNIITTFNNTRLSSVSLSADVSISDDSGATSPRLQISSLMDGSGGYVEMTGGIANNFLVFSTASYRGLQGYNYYTGLLARVHRTIYGDDLDLATFPGVGAAGINFQVLAPTVTEIILELDVTLQQGISIAAVENEVNTAITGYINGLGVGEDVIVEELRARTIRINGITDVSITRLVGGTSTTTVANIAIADNEIARIKTSDITLG